MSSPALLVHPQKVAQGDIQLPGSKSISNRVLLLSALSKGTTRLAGLLDADDTRVMRDALQTLGVQQTTFIKDGQEILQIEGNGGRFTVERADLFMGNAGTAIRPLTAALAVLGGEYLLHGVPRMHERPIADLVEGLLGIGANIEYVAQHGYPPIRIHHGDIREHKLKEEVD